MAPATAECNGAFVVGDAAARYPSAVEIEVLGRALLKPGPIVVGRVLEKLGGLLEQLLALSIALVLLELDLILGGLLRGGVVGALRLSQVVFRIGQVADRLIRRMRRRCRRRGRFVGQRRFMGPRLLRLVRQWGLMLRRNRCLVPVR